MAMKSSGAINVFSSHRQKVSVIASKNNYLLKNDSNTDIDRQVALCEASSLNFQYFTQAKHQAIRLSLFAETRFPVILIQVITPKSRHLALCSHSMLNSEETIWQLSNTIHESTNNNKNLRFFSTRRHI